MRSGSATLASGVASSECTACPRKEGSSTPSTISVGDERGLANCPAMRPTLITGNVAP